MPTEESRIELKTDNTEETLNERAEEQRPQSNDNEHETHQLDPTSRESSIATTDELRTSESHAKEKSTKFVIFTRKVFSTRHDN